MSRRLLVHHGPLVVASSAALFLFTQLRPSHGGLSVRSLILPSGYVGLVLLAVSLLLGPANLVLRRRNPVNSYLRRDVGTWTAVWSIFHVIVGFQGRGRSGAFGFIDYFVADGRPLVDSFGLGNWTGLAATVILVLLLVLSTDRCLRELKASVWKDVQRLNYTLFVLVVAHALLYGALRRMTSPYTLLLFATVAAVGVGQAVGIWLWRRRAARPEAGSGRSHRSADTNQTPANLNNAREHVPS